MAAITSAGSGLSTATTTWVGGVVPVEGDTVTIAAGHTVTIAGTHIWGNDTATAALTIAGTVYFSRSVSTTLTFKGNIVTTGTAAAWDRGTIADPIPLSVTHRIYLNYSATPANFKYRALFGISPSGKLASFNEVGYYRNRFSTVTADLPANATSCDVVDVTGWQIGDVICFAPTDFAAGINSREHRVLTNIVGNTISWVGGVSSKLANSAVGNLSSNVSWESYSTTAYGQVSVGILPGMSAGVINIKNIAYHGLGVTGGSGGLSLEGSTYYSNSLSPWGVISDNAFSNVGWNGTNHTVNSNLFSSFTKTRPFISNCVFYHRAGTANGGIWTPAGAPVTANNCWFFSNYLHSSNYSEGGISTLYNNCKLFDMGAQMISASSVTGAVYNNITTGKASSIIYLGSGDATFNNCNLSAFTYIVSASPATNYVINFNDCVLTGPFINTTVLAQASDTTKITVINKNNVFNTNEIWTRTGSVIRSTAGPNSLSSAILNNIVANELHTINTTLAVTSGVTYTIVANVKFDTLYGSTYLPRIIVSGQGVSSTTISSNTPNTWQKLVISFTPTSTGDVTIQYSGQSAVLTGNFWIDGLNIPKMIDWSYHYGYLYNTSSVTQTVDLVVQLSEASAAALTGISYSTGTLTISSAHTIREIYDWLKWYETSNHLVPLITSSDGINFALASNLALNGALTGTGTLTLGANTLTVTGGISSIPITHATGVFTAISINGIQSGSRVQIYDVTSATELYNSIAGTSITLPVTWSANHTIRVRALYCAGLAAKLPFEQSSVLTANGLTMEISQVTDTIYVANAIDGSTVTEFTADYNNVLVNVSDPDGVTTVQRMYAWYVSASTTALGIIAYFNAATAEDASNYRVNASIINLKIKNMSTQPTVVTGARMYRDDFSSIFDVGVGPIQLEPGKAYLANSPKLDEVHGRLGLDAAKPLSTSSTNISFGTTSMNLTESLGTVTVTRTS